MFRLTIKHLLANKVRFALTTLGVMLAVSFVVSAFVLGDGLRSTFTKVSEEVTAGVDLEVRNTADFGDPPPLPPTRWPPSPRVDGVADAVANIESRRQRGAPDHGRTATRSRPTARRSWRSTGSTIRS